MRTQTAAESTLLAGNNYGVHLRVKVANGSGTLVDLSAYVEQVTIDEDIDQPTAQATIEFRRDAGATLSLAPFRTDSTLNRLNDGTTYSPQLDAGRLITIEVAATAIGTDPVAGDWKERFRGYIDEVDSAAPAMSAVARDEGGVLADRWIETEKAYGYNQSISTVMQAILDDTLGSGVVTLTTLGTPSFNIRTYTQQSESLMSALRALAQLICWDVRYKWNGTAFALTLYEPPRSKTVPDRTFGPSTYYHVTRLSVGRDEVRNAIEIDYPVAGGRTALSTTDSTSIARYGRRFMGITEASDSSIDTGSEANVLIGNVLLDLKDPKAEQEVEAQPFWPAELGDLYRFSANGVHYDTDQDWAVTNIREELWGGTGRTHLQVRGSPSGGYLTWLGRAGSSSAGGGLSPGDAADIEGWIDLESARIAGQAARGLVGENDERSGRGGAPVDGQAYSDRPLYRKGGDAPLIDTGTDTMGTALKGPAGTAVATIEDGGNRGVAGLSATGDVARDVPRARAAAQLPAISVTDGKVLDTVEISGKAGVYPVATDDNVAALANGATVEDGSTRARTGLAVSGDVARGVPLTHAVANVPAVSGTTGKLLDTVEISGKAGVFPVATDDNVAALANGATVEDGATRARTALDTSNKLVTGVTAAAKYADGVTGIDALKPAEAGANVTETRTAADVQVGVGKAVLEVGANKTETRTSADTAAVAGTAAGTVRDHAARGDQVKTKVDADVGTAVIENEPQAQRRAARQAGTGARGITAENEERSGCGGIPVEGEAYSSLPIMDPTGSTPRIDPATGEVTNSRIASSTNFENPGGTLGSGVKQTNAGAARSLAKGYQSGYVKDGIGVTFAQSYQNPPMVLMSGGISWHPNLGTAARWYEEFIAQNLSGTGFTCYAKVKTKGTVTARTAQFTAPLTAAGGGDTIGPATLVNAPSSNNSYKVRWKLTVSCTTTPEIPSGSVEVVVAIEVNDGVSGWLERYTRSRTISRSTSGTTTTTFSPEEHTVSDATLGANDQIRLKLKSITITGADTVGSATLEGFNNDPTSEGNGVEYSTSADVIESKTPDAEDYVFWEAFEVVQ